MRIAVIGANGRTGRLVAESVLARGHDVTAIVRSPDKLGELARRVRVVTASAGDVDGIATGIADAGAVISTLGHSPSSGDEVLADGIRTDLAAMQRAGHRRLVMTSAAGITTDGDGWFTRSILKPLLGLVLRKPFTDTRNAEALLRASDLDWVIVRPPMLRDGEANGYVSQERLNVRGLFTMNRADLAEALVDLTLDASPRTVFAVASKKPVRAAQRQKIDA
ncbi:NAD(P)H-binding protein [Planctomonas sp. JC2975]|uniref:NAD(P)-dependent oxidoreductase n=1 Tax=Planctomonas sp. JC2975 TaxID=2729626 RepID=UPI0014736236|nr:NAD(P)H-binding protein [Planctomonas sp. JC2975]NNC13470.1 NAD(P)H-binding protein [Planctomonas sp. JC2975]